MRLKNNNSKDELSQLTNTFNEMLDRLENSFESQKQFVSNISHEIRTPLAAIITELELLSHKERTILEYKSAVQNALNDSRRLARLSTSLLDFAKASYDPSEIAFKTVRIDELLLDARQQVQQANRNYKIDIHFETDFETDQQISVNGNKYLLTVAFVNLFENACKFSDNNKSKVSFNYDSEKIILKFSNNGIGISEEDLNSIFDLFYRGQNENIAHGNGIGLSLTQRVILLHQGTISVESQKNKTTTFTVELPNL